MAKFVDINSLTEKDSLTGNETIQISDTEKVALNNILTKLGLNIQMVVSAINSWFPPSLNTKVKVQACLNALAFACGIRQLTDAEKDTFRFLHGDNGDASLFGVIFWDRVKGVKVAVLLSSYGVGEDSGDTFPLAIYEGGGTSSDIRADITDSAFIQEITTSGKWNIILKISKGGDIYTSDVIAATSDKPITLPGQFVFPSLNNLKLDSFVKQLIYNTGYHAANACMRTLLASYAIGGTGSNVQCYYGVTWYNSYYGRTYVMLVNTELANGKYITLYVKQGRHIENNPNDGAYVNDVITGNWTKVAEIGTGSSGPINADNVNVDAPTLYDETQEVSWDPSVKNNLQEFINGILYRIGLRYTTDGSGLGFRIVVANSKMAIISNDQSSSDYNVFLFSGGSQIHTYLIDSSYVMEWISGNFSDQSIINSIESDGSETGMLDMVGISNFATKAYVQPKNGVLTMFPSGYRTVIPGENITTNLTSGTLKIKVPDLLTAQVKNGPFMDAVIDVPYGVTVQFANQVEILYKADGVDGFTVTSGRKVYTIHYVPTTSSTANITFRAFVNVTNYK